MSPFIGSVRARAVLIEHGIDPDTDPDTLTTAIEERGWRVSVEQSGSWGGGRPPRWRALATRPTSELGGTGQSLYHLASGGTHLLASGPSARHVLVAVLAQVLNREPPPAGS